MEAYFHSDPRIEEWVNQITEKIFTVCLLTGVESEAEFHKGCQLVTKVTHLLQGIAIFPPEYLEDGLKQLLEQQLPDSRVINNFPTFRDIMNKMIIEGMASALDNRDKADFKVPANTAENTSELVQLKLNIETSVGESTPTEAEYGGPLPLVEVGVSRLDEHLKETNGCFVSELYGELDTEGVIAALALVDNTTPTLAEPSIPSKPYGIIRKTQGPDEADQLKHILGKIFPNISVCWNLNLMGQTFLAQVEDILICLNDPEKPCPVSTLQKEGWRVYVCSSNDLRFPRRLERGIKQILRLGKQC